MFHPCQAEDEDEDERVQGFHDDCFHLAEFHTSSLFLRVFCFFGVLNLVFSGVRFFGGPSKINFEGRPTSGHKYGKVPRQFCWSYPTISGWNSKTRSD